VLTPGVNRSFRRLQRVVESMSAVKFPIVGALDPRRPLWNREARSAVFFYGRAMAFGLASAAESISRRTEMTRTQTSNALSWHYSISLCAVAGSFAMILPPTSSAAQTIQGTPAAYRAEAGPPLDPRTLSCDALKDRRQRMGALYVTGRQGWGETFYSVPQCEFWATPSFEYVSASDGACGLGYLCQWKPGAGSSR